jgi:hypothetical protein
VRAAAGSRVLRFAADPCGRLTTKVRPFGNRGVDDIQEGKHGDHDQHDSYARDVPWSHPSRPYAFAHRIGSNCSSSLGRPKDGRPGEVRDRLVPGVTCVFGVGQPAQGQSLGCRRPPAPHLLGATQSQREHDD